MAKSKLSTEVLMTTEFRVRKNVLRISFLFASEILNDYNANVCSLCPVMIQLDSSFLKDPCILK